VVTRLSAKTAFDLYARYSRFRYTGDDAFLGTTLAERFNRRASAAGATFRYSLTPLTALTLTGDWAQERFDETPTRDNNSIRLVPGVELAPDALLKGSAKFGYRRFDALNVDIPDFDGLVASVDLSYVLLGRTRFNVLFRRDIEFSFETVQPYYLQTGLGGGVRQGLGRGWDVEARASTYRLDYRTSTKADSILQGRVDRVTSYGGGVGYRLSDGSRLGFTVDQFNRSSETLEIRDYNSLRYGFNVTYAF
jgi:hypothetical protein